MTDAANAFQPAIDALETELADLERQANNLVGALNVLRSRAGLPPRPGGFSPVTSGGEAKNGGTPGRATIKSDAFTGKKLGSAVREYLEMRERAGIERTATTREIFDALKDGGYVSGAKDDETGMVVLRTMLRKNTTMFAKLPNGRVGLSAWYPGLKAPKKAVVDKASDDVDDEAVIETADDSDPFEDETNTADATKTSAA
jgi:hypothetical protein